MLDIQRNIQIKGANNKLFLADLYRGENAKNIVIFCHGFKGFKDWGAWDLVGKYFASKGCQFLKFNFSHNGTTLESPSDFDDLASFGRNNYSKELEDLNAVFQWIIDQKRESKLQFKRIHTIGHSRGGPIAIIGGLNNCDVRSVTTWAGVPNLDYAFLPRFMQEWKRNGVRYISNGRTNQQMPLGYHLVEDYYANEQSLDLLQAYDNANNKPRMHFIHGETDQAIPYAALDRLKEMFPGSSTSLIPNTGHTFRSSHPWVEDTLPKSLLSVCDITLRNVMNDL